MANTYCKKCKLDIKKYLKSNIRLNYCPICGNKLCAKEQEVIDDDSKNINNNFYLPEFLTKGLKKVK